MRSRLIGIAVFVALILGELGDLSMSDGTKGGI
jgi:hypothetical protein